VNVRLLDLEYFVVLAEELSFSRAADRLYLAQQAVSAQIGQLERRLGVQLVERSTRPIQLTAAGAVFLEHARGLLAAADAAVEATRQAAGGGTLRIGFLPAAALELTQPILSSYARSHPQVRVELRERRIDDTSGGLRTRDVDVAFVRAPFNDDGLVLECLAKDPRVLAVATGHPLVAKATVELGDIVGAALISCRTRDRTSAAFWLALDSGSAPSEVIDVATYEEQLELVAAGHGVSLTGAAAARYYGRPEVAYRQFADLSPCDVALAWRRGDANPLIPGFVAAARQVRDAEPALVERIGMGLLAGA
jgi:DNA-binding transcriptional LysR family regulator